MKRQISRARLAHRLLAGTLTSDPEGWYPKRRYPSGKRELAARQALADELRREAPDGYFVHIIAAMIDPRTDSELIRQKIEFAPAKDSRLETKTSWKLDHDIARFMHEYREKHPGRGSVTKAVDAAVDHFGFETRRIEEAWKMYKPSKRKPQTVD